MHKTLQTLYAYWNDVRAGRLAPRRLEIEPAAIAPILADTFMLERAADDSFQFRLAGTRVCDLYGRELRGLDFLSDFQGAERNTVQREIATMCDRGAVLKLATHATADARHSLDVETILLPLVHAGESIGRVLGASVPTAKPEWLGHHKLQRQKLIEHELVWPDDRPFAVVARSTEPPPFRSNAGVVRIVRSENRTFRVLQGGRTERD